MELVDMIEKEKNVKVAIESKRDETNRCERQKLSGSYYTERMKIKPEEVGNTKFKREEGKELKDQNQWGVGKNQPWINNQAIN